MTPLLLALAIAVDGGSPSAADAGGVDTVDAGLATDGGPSPAKPLQTVVAATSDERSAGSAHTLKSSRLNRVELDDPMAVLQQAPGVYARGEDGFGLRPNIGLRGANSDRSKKVTLMEDGVLFAPAPYSAPAAYYFPLVTRMEAVRVVKGPAGILYGPATVGGAIDFITRDIPSQTSAGADLALGEYWYGKAHGWFGTSNDTTGFLMEALHLRSSGFKQLDGGGDTGFGRTELMSKGRYRLSLGDVRHVFTMKFGIASEESNETYLGLSDDDFRATPLRRYAASALDHMSALRTSVALTHQLDVGAVTVNTTAYRNDFHRVWHRFDRFRSGEFPGPMLAVPTSPRNAVYVGLLKGQLDSTTPEEQLLLARNDRTFVAMGVQSELRASFVTGPLQHSLEASARYHFDSADKHHTGDTYDMRGGALSAASVPVVELLHDFDSTHALALSVLDSVRWGALTFSPGLRFELIRSSSVDRLAGTVSNGGAEVVAPGASLHWALTPQLGLLAGVHRGFSPPAPGQRAAPELSVNYEAGARWTRRQERFEVIGFFNDYSNLVGQCSEVAGCGTSKLEAQFSAGRAHVYGLEVFAEKTFRFAESVVVPLSAAYTLTGSQLLDAFDSSDPQFANARVGDELPYIPRHLINLTAGLDVWRLSFTAQFNFIDRMREVVGQGDSPASEWTDAVATLDLHAGIRLASWAQLYFDARNVTDSRAIVARRPFGARPNAPRTFIGGLKLTY